MTERKVSSGFPDIPRVYIVEGCQIMMQKPDSAEGNEPCMSRVDQTSSGCFATVRSS